MGFSGKDRIQFHLLVVAVVHMRVVGAIGRSLKDAARWMKLTG